MPSGVARVGGSGLWTPPPSGDENPYKYGIHGLTDGRAWSDIRVVSDRFHGTIVNFAASNYDDGVVLFPGVWGDNVRITFQIYRGPNATAAISQEVEALFCGCAGPYWWSMYEALVSVHGSSLYADLARWNGPQNQFDQLQHVTNPTAPIIADGDWFKVEKIGAVVTSYYARAATPTTWVQLCSVTLTSSPPVNPYGPTVYTRGLVGLGIWQRGGSASNLLEFGINRSTVLIEAA
jgi:hypothetical protein